jgi:O-antigen ligase
MSDALRAPLRARPWLPALVGLSAGLSVVVHPLAGVALGAVALGAWVGVARPDALVAGMFLAMLFDRMGAMSSEVAGLPLTLSKLAVAGSLALWGVHVVVTRRSPLRWHPVLTALVGMVAAAGFGVLTVGTLHEARFTLYGLGMVTALTALVYTILSDRDPGPLYRLLSAALCASIVLSVVGPMGAQKAGRATGTMGDPNEWGTVLLLLGPTLLGGLAHDPHRLARPLRLGLMTLVPVAVLASGSRTALVVGLLVGVASVFMLRRQKGELLACASGGVLGLVVLGGIGGLSATSRRLERLWASLNGTAVIHDDSLRERSELLAQAWDLFLENWLLGVGPGRFEVASGFVSITGRLRPAHNTYLEVASEQGLVGLAAGAVLFATVGFTLWSGLRSAADPARTARVTGVAIGLGAFALMAATLGLLTFSMAYLVLGLGLAVAHPRTPHAAPGDPHGR